MLENLKIGDRVQFGDGTFSTVTFVQSLMGTAIYVTTEDSYGTYCSRSGINLGARNGSGDNSIAWVYRSVEPSKTEVEQLAKQLGGRVIWD